MTTDPNILGPCNRPLRARRVRLRRKDRIFMGVNALVLGCIGAAWLTNPAVSVGNSVYLITLSLECTLPLLFATSYRGRASLLIVFLAYYFATFGVGELVQLFSPQPLFNAGSTGFTGGAIAILLGAFCFIIGYAAIVWRSRENYAGWSARDWSNKAAAIIGIGSWSVGWILTEITLFGGGDPYSGHHINPMVGGFLALGRLLQPVGSLLLIYLYITTRNKKILTILLATIALDAALGFFGGSKQIALRAPILFLLSFILLRERIPVLTLVIFTLLTALFFNAAGHYRNELFRHRESRGTAVSRVAGGNGTLLKQSIPVSKQLSAGFDYFVSRISEKWVIDLVVNRTGSEGIPYQDGATLTPLLYIFIPRFITPNKPNNITGKLFNDTFSIASGNTFIAITNLGDLYWNFGWFGIIIGMTAIGSFMAWAAIKFRLDRNMTLPKFLFLAITIYFLILKFEGGVALDYTLWARVAALLLLVHAVAPKASYKMSRFGGYASTALHNRSSPRNTHASR